MHPEPARLADKPEDYARLNLERATSRNGRTASRRHRRTVH